MIDAPFGWKNGQHLPIHGRERYDGEEVSADNPCHVLQCVKVRHDDRQCGCNNRLVKGNERDAQQKRKHDGEKGFSRQDTVIIHIECWGETLGTEVWSFDSESEAASASCIRRNYGLKFHDVHTIGAKHSDCAGGASTRKL